MNITGILFVFRIAERAEQPVLHDLREPDYRVQRGPQFVRNIGKKF